LASDGIKIDILKINTGIKLIEIEKIGFSDFDKKINYQHII